MFSESADISYNAIASTCTQSRRLLHVFWQWIPVGWVWRRGEGSVTTTLFYSNSSSCFSHRCGRRMMRLRQQQQPQQQHRHQQLEMPAGNSPKRRRPGDDHAVSDHTVFLYACTFLQVDNAGKTHACGGEGEWIGDRWVCSAGHTCLPFVL